MVLIEEALRFLSRHIDGVILRLFRHVLTSSFFSFNCQFYEQIDGVAMGSPLFTVIANYCMEYFEEMTLETAIHKSLCWFRYVDDTFVI
jgi:oligoendopeptidase F